MVLLLGLQLTAAVRLDEALLGLDLDLVAATKNDEDKCNTKLVEDAVRCGVDRVIEMVRDGVRCGFEWCDNELTFFLCPKLCEGETKEVPKTCEILVSCPVKIELHIQGESPTSSINSLHLDAKLVDYKITQDNLPDLQATLDGNYDTILPWMQEVVDIVLPLANEELKGGVSTFEKELLGMIENDIVNEYDWAARLLLGGKGFGDGLLTAFKSEFSSIGANMHKRQEVTAPVEDTDQKKLCDRTLRIRPKDGEEYLITDWKNALVARKYDYKTDCNTVYTAHCGTGTFTRTTECANSPEKTQTDERCMFSKFCWVGKRTINNNEALTLYKGNEEIISYADVLVDHVAGPSSESKQKVMAAKSAADAGPPKELATLIQIYDNELPGVIKHEVCKQLRENAWFGFGTIVAARCGVMFSALLANSEISQTLPLGEKMTVDADISMTGGVFKTEFIPKWDEFAALADSAVHTALAASAEPLPLNATLQSVNCKVSGDGDKFFVEARPVLIGTLSEEQIEELRERLTEKA